MTTIEGFLELVQARRSVGGFELDRDVPDELVKQLIEAARWAPSGGKGQPWPHFVVVRDQADRE